MNEFEITSGEAGYDTVIKKDGKVLEGVSRVSVNMTPNGHHIDLEFSFQGAMKILATAHADTDSVGGDCIAFAANCMAKKLNDDYGHPVSSEAMYLVLNEVVQASLNMDMTP